MKKVSNYLISLKLENNIYIYAQIDQYVIGQVSSII